MGTITKSDRRWIVRVVRTLGRLVEPEVAFYYQSFNHYRFVRSDIASWVDPNRRYGPRAPEPPDGFVIARSYPADLVHIDVGRVPAEFSGISEPPPPPTRGLTESLEHWLGCSHLGDRWERIPGRTWGVHAMHEYHWSGHRLDATGWGIVGDWYENRGDEEVAEWIRCEARCAAGEEAAAARTE